MNIEIRRLNSERVLYDEKLHRYTDEKSIITVNGDFVLIECSGDKSEFYARNYLKNNDIENGECVVCPAFKKRGYIEGFYGNPWNTEKRISIIKALAAHGMNTYYYAPKDDPYHRRLWRDLYPENELNELKKLINTAKTNFTDLVWCTAPGLDIQYSSDKDFALLINKINQLYDSGVKSFGLLLDDINESLQWENDKLKYGETVNAHIDLINRLYSRLASEDVGISLTVCPTLYCGSGSEYYISKLGRNIPSNVSLFWTGRDICSRELLSSDAVRFFENTLHKPLYWDNYPVNDMAMHFEMHLGPYIGRDRDLCKYSDGIILNCMEYARCSLIPLLTAADFMWAPDTYDPDKSWRNAVKETVGAENADCFIAFADNLRLSCLQDENAGIFKSIFMGKINEKAAENYIKTLKDAEKYLKSDAPLCAELKKWSEKFFSACEIIDFILQYRLTREPGLKETVLKLLDSYNSLPERLIDDSDFLEALCQEDFTGEYYCS